MTEIGKQGMKTIADLMDEVESQSQTRPQEELLMECLTALLKQFSDYTPPRLRSDGGILIPLDAELQKSRERSKNAALAIKSMMDRDHRPKKSRTWVE
mgnify:FL=1